MRKLIMWNMITLDGLFEGPKKWDLDWHEYVWGEEMEKFSTDQLKTADMLLFGRLTYQGMADYWTTAKGEVGEVADFMNGLPKVVFSRTLQKADWNNTRLVKENAEAEVKKLKAQPGQNLFIFGSADFSASMMAAGLIDEFRLGMNPLILGGGGPLFKPGSSRLRLELLEARPMKSGLVLLTYQPLKEA